MLSLIVAYDKNKSIGQENTIPWRLKNDMLRVKELTTNQTIIMGRKTLDSIGRALPNRINRVLTRDKNSLSHYSDIEVYTDDGETADSFIEREVFLRQGKYTNVYVVTSDGAEQNQILGSGGLRIPARELQNDMRLAKQEERLQYTHKHHRDQMVLRRNEVYDHLDPDVAKKLEAIRRGTK